MNFENRGFPKKSSNLALLYQELRDLFPLLHQNNLFLPFFNIFFLLKKMGETTTTASSNRLKNTMSWFYYRKLIKKFNAFFSISVALLTHSTPLCIWHGIVMCSDIKWQVLPLTLKFISWSLSFTSNLYFLVSYLNLWFCYGTNFSTNHNINHTDLFS